MTQLATIGHNNAPVDTIEEQLAQEYTEFLRASVLLKAQFETLPKKAENEDDAVAINDYIASASKFKKDGTSAHKREKEPWLKKGQAVDGFFNPRIKEIESFSSAAQRVLGQYLAEKARIEREEREAAQRALREEAERKAQEAADMADMGATAAAEDVKKEADALANDAESLVTAPTTARVYGSTGTASLRAKKVGVIVDADNIDWNALRQYIDGDIRQKIIDKAVAAGVTAITGVEIKDDYSARVR